MPFLTEMNRLVSMPSMHVMRGGHGSRAYQDTLDISRHHPLKQVLCPSFYMKPKYSDSLNAASGTQPSCGICRVCMAWMGKGEWQNLCMFR